MICDHGAAVFDSNQKFLANFCNVLAIGNTKSYGALFVKTME